MQVFLAHLWGVCFLHERETVTSITGSVLLLGGVVTVSSSKTQKAVNSSSMVPVEDNVYKGAALGEPEVESDHDGQEGSNQHQNDVEVELGTHAYGRLSATE